MSTAITEPPKKEVAAAKKPATLKDLIQGDAFKQAVSSALPKHLTADRFCRVAATTLMRVPKLAQCDQASFFNCLLTLSQYGLEPDGRNAHLIPFENKKKGIVECQLIIDYKGLVELAMRSGLIARIHADVVCINDAFEYNMGDITEHKIDLKVDRGEVYAAYAKVTFRDGTSKCEVMSKADIHAIRDRSQGWTAFKNGWAKQSPWDPLNPQSEGEMFKKTCFRRLSKWISISAEFRDAVDADDDVIETTVANQPKTRIADLVIDTDLLPEPPQEPEQPADTVTLEATASPPGSAQKAAAKTQKSLVSVLDQFVAAIADAKTAGDCRRIRLDLEAALHGNKINQEQHDQLRSSVDDKHNDIDAQEGS